MSSLSELVRDRRHNYIAGEWIAPAKRRYFEVENPYTQQMVAVAPASTSVDLDAAVAAASAAAPGWADTDPAERAQYLDRVREGLQAHLETFAQCWSTEVGIPLSIARAATGGLPIGNLRSAADLARSMPWETHLGNSRIVHAPLGVVGVITPWNYPLLQIITKTVSALAAGCTVVAKPSEIAPLCAFGFFDLLHEAGLPAGVVNLVGGDGREVGSALAGDPRLGAISFTGSTTTGSQVMAAAARNITRVCLELGGKSASVVLDAASLEEAVVNTSTSCLRNSGQTCTSLTRLVVPRSIAKEATERAVEVFSQSVMGDPMDERTTLGPLISAVQRDRVRHYIAEGQRSGARLVLGGAAAPATQPMGYFVQPTVFTDVDPMSPIAQEEIFGPVLSIIVVEDEQEALQVANGVDFGLAGSVWAADLDRAVAFAMRVEAGSISVNGGPFNPAAPYGGLKRSGIGAEHGRYGIEEFLSTRVLNLPVN